MTTKRSHLIRPRLGLSWVLLFLCCWTQGIGLHPALADAPIYTAGQQYLSIEPPAPVQVAAGEIEVVVLFWYGCPHCYRFEDDVAPWAAQQPADVRIVRMPLALSERWEVFARVYYAAEALGVLDRTHTALFRALHDERRRFSNEADIAAFCASAAGIETAVFAKAMDSLYTHTKVAQDRRLAQQYRVSSVPNMVVQGKYLVSAGTAGGPKQALAVVDFLIEKERAALANLPL